MRFAPAVAAILLLSACFGASPNEPVTAEQMATIHASLRRADPIPGHHYGCGEQRLGAETKGEELVVYLVYSCGSWLSGACAVDAMDSGSSAAVVTRLRGQTVVSMQFPGDGSQYASDIKAWFPKGLRQKANFPGNGVRDRLIRDAAEDSGCS